MKFKVSIDGSNSGKTTFEADWLEEAEHLARQWVLHGYWPEMEREDFVAFTIEDEDGIEWPFDEVVRGYAEPDCVDGLSHDWKAPHTLVGGSPRCPGQFALDNGEYRFEEVCCYCGRYRTTLTGGGRSREPQETYRMADRKSLAWVAKCRR